MSNNENTTALLESLFSDEATKHERLEYVRVKAAQFMEESPVPEGAAKVMMCKTLANNCLIAEYLAEKLAAEGGLKGEHLRIYTGVNSAIGRQCKQLGIGVVKDDGGNLDDF